ncbi:MAG TPA: glycoside hydrolase family 3 C-terminal domain-containing protein [bacterium]|nr:glycoside hydrolase family 3 C-terminal domain-containing protein [bacterium]
MDRRDFLKTAGVGAAVAAAPGAMWAKTAALGRDEIEERVRELLGKMSLSEKIKQMSGNVIANTIHFAQGYGKVHTVNTPDNKRLGIPGIRFIDGPRGINIEGSTCFPVAMARGASWDLDLMRRVGGAMGYEARAWGANYFGGVCINVLRHPSWGRSQETFGEDPHHLGVLGVAETKGLQDHVMACAKHFTANSIDLSRHYVDVRMDERTLREVYLPHYKMCVDAGVASFMSAYNQLNGELCGHNHHLLTDILKNEWGFPGFVVSDFTLGVKATVPAAKAGLDVEMPSTMYYGPRLKAAVKQGKAPLAAIDQAVTRILREKLRFIHLEDAAYDRKKIAGPEHVALAREAAEKSIVLLKNESGALPLQDGIKSIAVLGELADTGNIGDHGSSVVRPPYVITALAGIRQRAGAIKVMYEAGADPAAAEKAAAGADAVIVVAGCDYRDEGEGFDRVRLSLSDRHEKLVRIAAGANPRAVVVLEGGGAITMEGWRDKVPAIVMAWYPGMEGGTAIAGVLFGDVNPSGKLPAAWPESADQLFPFDNKAKTVQYDRYHGYRWFDKKGLEPAFPFGHGLSYTQYKYSNLRLDRERIGPDGKVTASVDVTNTGGRDGEEIVQLYVGAPGSKVDRAIKELKAFTKIKLAAGDTKTVSLQVSAKDLAYFNQDTNAWEIEPLEYRILVGPSSRAEDLMGAGFKISGA